MIEQDLKIFELESLIEQLRRQLKYSEFKIESHISNLTSTNEEKKLLETKLNEILQNQFSDLNSIKNENDLIKQDLMLEKEKKLKMQEEIEKFQLEIFFFKECTKELERQRDKYANNLEMLKNERMIEQMNLEKALDQLKFENENIENDKKRIQEEMEILIQTYNFENHEINQIKENNKILKEKVTNF